MHHSMLSWASLTSTTRDSSGLIAALLKVHLCLARYLAE
jgi:hypothetical protein